MPLTTVRLISPLRALVVAALAAYTPLVNRLRPGNRPADGAPKRESGPADFPAVAVMRFLFVQRLLFFLYWLGPRFDAGAVRLAWHNTRLRGDAYVPWSAFGLWRDALRRVV